MDAVLFVKKKKNYITYKYFVTNLLYNLKCVAYFRNCKADRPKQNVSTQSTPGESGASCALEIYEAVPPELLPVRRN